MNLPLFTLRNRSLVTLLVLLVTGIGIVSYGGMSQREDPDVRVTIALVVTIWPGASAEKVERFISSKIEEKALEISDVGTVSSTSRDNISVIFVDALFEADTNVTFQDLRNRIAHVELPDDVIGPDIIDDFGDVTSMIWAFSSKTATPSELASWAERFEARLRTIESVGKIERIGEQPEAIYIEGLLESFTQYGFSPLTAAQILESQNVAVPSGYVRTDATNLRLETSGEFEAVGRIREAILDVSRDSGHPLRVSDVFEVSRRWRDPPIDLMLSNGVPALGIDVRMRRGHNIVDMGIAVRKVAEEIEQVLPPDIELSLLHDQPYQVDSFVGSFMRNLVQGLFIVVIVIFLAMGIRSAGLVALSLPLSIVFTFAVMPLLGVDLEIVSIGAFIVALGMLVDNAIIVTENIAVHLQRGASPREAAELGSQEIVGPVITGTMATVCAFLPLLLMHGEIGAYIRSLPIVVSASLLASMLLALTLTPMLAVWWMRAHPRRPPPGKSIPTRLYSRFIRKALELRHLVLGLALASLLGAALLAGHVGLSFFPEAFRNQFTVDVWLPESASIDETHRLVDEVISIVDEDPAVTSHAAYIGKGGPRFHITVSPVFNTVNYGQLMVNTNSAAKTPAAIDRLNEAFRTRIAGAQVTAKPLYLGIPVEAPIAVRIYGPDLDVIQDLSEMVQDVLRSVPGSYRVRDNLGEDVVSLRVEVDGDAALVSGVTQTEVALGLLSTYEGLPVTRLRDGEAEVDVFLRLSESDRKLDTLESIEISSFATGEKVPLAAFATVKPQWKPSRVQRRDGQRSITVMSWVHERLADDVLRDALPGIEAIDLPEDYRVELAGEHVERTKAFRGLAVVFGVILALILLMLVIQFKSIARALVILFSVPLALVGALLGLYLAGESISLMAFLGVASLAGMVIKNAVVWVEFVDRAVKAGRDMGEAVVEAGQMRLRPILLTASTTIGALLPLALFGGVLWRGMAWALISGLALATVLTLVVIPCLYFTAFGRSAGGALSASAKGAVVLAFALMIPPGIIRADHGADADAMQRESQASSSTHPIAHYLKSAKERSGPVLSARIDLEEAGAQRDMARAAFFPKAGFLATATRLDRAQTLDIDAGSLGLPLEFPPMLLADQNVYGVGATLTLPIYAGGRRKAFMEAAGHGRLARARALEAVEAGMAFKTAAYYVRALEADWIAGVLEQALDVERRVIEITRAKMVVDMAVPFDVSYAETRAADTERLLSMARSTARQRAAALNDLVGKPLDEAVALAHVSPDSSFEPKLDDLLEGIGRRAEVLAMEEATRAQKARVRAARGEMLPSFALVGEGGYREGEVGYLDGRGYWTLTAAMQWELDLVALRRAQQKRVQVRRQVHDGLEARRELTLELHQAHQLHRDTKTILEVARRGARTAAEGLQNARIAFDAGMLEAARLLDASRALAEAKEGYLKAYFARVLSEMQLRYHAGLDVVTEVNLAGEDPFSDLRLPDLDWETK